MKNFLVYLIGFAILSLIAWYGLKIELGGFIFEIYSAKSILGG